MAAPLVLASTSPWRAQILADVGIACAVVPPGFDEDAVVGSDPVDLAVRRAAGKAWAVARGRPDAWVAGADQVAHLDGEAFGKPRDPDDHRRRLRQLRGRTHHLTTAVSLVVDAVEHRLVTHTGIVFRGDLEDAELDAYVASGDGSGCAGGYRAEGPGGVLIAAIEGDWFNVIGLPVFPLVSLLRSLGWRPAFPVAPTGDVA